MYGTLDRIRRQPRWGALYAIATAMLALLGVVEAVVPVGALRRALEIAVTVLGFWSISLWVRANGHALDLAGARDPGFRRVVEQPAIVADAGRASHREPKPRTPAPERLAGTVLTLPRRRSNS